MPANRRHKSTSPAFVNLLSAVVGGMSPLESLKVVAQPRLRRRFRLLFVVPYIGGGDAGQRIRPGMPM